MSYAVYARYELLRAVRNRRVVIFALAFPVILYLAIAGPKRLPAFQDVPTVAEAGGPAGFEVSGWTAIAAPKGLPKAVADKIQRDIEKALAEPDVREKFVSFGYESFTPTREQFNQYIASESTRFAGIIKKAGAFAD